MAVRTQECGERRRLLYVASILICGFVLIEVNYPVMQPQSRLAVFGLLGLLLVFTNCPAFKPRPGNRLLRVLDWGLCAAALASFSYVIVQTEPAFKRLWIHGLSLGDRAGQEVLTDYVAGFFGLLVVLEAARRTVGIALPILTLVFLMYARFGAALPGWMFPHRGYTWSRIVSQTFLHSQGVFGIALKVMFTYVFPFILFGALLEATGATGFIIDLSRRLFGRSAGGPAKVAVLSSGMMGSLSGSAVANTATTGTFTIPMMRSAGFKPHMAAGVEAAASSGGALMPPVMGAGAYMMLEIVSPPVTYIDIIRAAIIPAILYYLALLLVVHLYARRAGGAESSGEENRVKLSPAKGMVFVSAFGSLIAFLVAGFSPFRAATLGLAVILLVAPWSGDTRLTWREMIEGLVRAARGGMALVAAASCVGMVLGVVTLTGIGSKLPAAILSLAQGNLFAALFLLMVSTIILGMGLPSAVCYLLMATLVGPVLTKLGIVPLAAHLFIFYFGMMSMVTPPVALAAYTAAAIAKADVMRSAMAAFRFALVGFALPYAFVLNPSLLLLTSEGQSTLWPALPTIGIVLAGIVFLAVSITGYCFRRVRPLPRATLFAAAFALFLSSGGGDHMWIRILAAAAGGAIIFLNARRLPADQAGAGARLDLEETVPFGPGTGDSGNGGGNLGLEHGVALLQSS